MDGDYLADADESGICDHIEENLIISEEERQLEIAAALIFLE